MDRKHPIIQKRAVVSSIILFLISLFFIQSWIKKTTVTTENNTCRQCNVVIVSMAGLRADHMSVYGYEKDTTPFLRSYAENSWVFNKYYLTSYLTPINEASFHTGLHPVSNGMINYRTPISKNTHTLAQVLRSHGYKAWALGSGPEFFIYPKIKDSFVLGFDDYFKTDRYSAEQKTLEWDKIEQAFAQEKNPFFVWISDSAAYLPTTLKESDQAKNKQLYEAGVLKADEHFSKIIDLLKKHNRLKNTVVIFQSSGGYELGENKIFAQYDISETATRSPFIFKSPALQDSKKIDDFVSSVDVMPTLLNHLGLDTNPENFDGENFIDKNGNFFSTRNHVFLTRTPLLEALIKNKKPDQFDQFRLLDDAKPNRDFAIRYKNYKLYHRKARLAEEQFSIYKTIITDLFPRRDFELYDIKKDPYETTKLNPNDIPEYERMLSILLGQEKKFEAKEERTPIDSFVPEYR